MIVKMDKDVEALVWPVSEIEYEKLEQLLLRNGCETLIRTWCGALIGDFPHYSICLTHQLPFQTKEICLHTREDMIIYVCKDQLKRTDIPENMRKYLIGKRYCAEKILTARNVAHNRQNSLYSPEERPHADPDNTQFRTSTLLEKEYHLCGTTIQKYGTFANAVDRIAAVDNSIREQLLSGQLWIAHNNLVRIAHMGERQIKLLITMIKEIGKSHIQAEDIDKMMEQKAAGRKPVPDWRSKASVKDMPIYDPDTEVLSLVFTIPSWRSSMGRVQSSTNVEQLSDAARQKLLSELEALQEETALMLKKVKE